MEIGTEVTRTYTIWCSSIQGVSAAAAGATVDDDTTSALDLMWAAKFSEKHCSACSRRWEMTFWVMCKRYPYCTGKEVLLPIAVARIPDYLPRSKLFPTKYKSNTASGLHSIPTLHWNNLQQVLQTRSADLLPGLSR